MLTFSLFFVILHSVRIHAIATVLIQGVPPKNGLQLLSELQHVHNRSLVHENDFSRERRSTILRVFTISKEIHKRFSYSAGHAVIQ